MAVEPLSADAPATETPTPEKGAESAKAVEKTSSENAQPVSEFNRSRAWITTRTS
jgi:hypothetical protein